MDLSAYDYHLPKESIAQTPAANRPDSKLLILERATGKITHAKFSDISSIMGKGDVLVRNNSKVIYARLYGKKITGGKVEILLMEKVSDQPERWTCLYTGAKIRVGSQIYIDNKLGVEIKCTMIDKGLNGHCIVEFNMSISTQLENIGNLPLPPYIENKNNLDDRYQTVYASVDGSIAAPTAGLHFDQALDAKLKDNGVVFTAVTLHVGIGTFTPIKVEVIENHKMHSEKVHIDEATIQTINNGKRLGRNIYAVGTTTVRSLEGVASKCGKLSPYDGEVELFIYPGFKFSIVDKLITNFHLPKTTLMAMIAAFIGQVHEDPDRGRQILVETYKQAIENDYKFYSFGDSMAII
ncbi:MAG: tRNA preQ1(34) S-adenosylmethionine ribosyltransferase-isomerase QueA [Chitinophagales bacterium]